MPNFKAAVITAGAMFLFCMQANASHFRYGHINWSQVQENTVKVKVQNAWQRDGYFCIDPATQASTPCSGADGLAGVGDVVADGLGGNTLDWGDGSSTGELLYVVTSVDPANNWLFTEALDEASLPDIDTSIEHSYAVAGNFLANLSNCCRTDRVEGGNEHINNPGIGYSVETLVNAGSSNSSPISIMPPFKLCPVNAVCRFKVPATDPDGDILKFRFSSADEAGGSFNQPSGATIDPNTGEFSWDTSGAELAETGNNTLYSTQIIIEDESSKVAVDFFIQLVDEGTSAPPVIEPPVGSAAICNTTQVVNIGDTKTFTITSTDPDAEDAVSLNVAGLPQDATMSPVLPISGNPVSSAFAWTPDLSQAGVHLIEFNSTSTNGGAMQCPVTLSVLAQCDIDGNAIVDKSDIQGIFAMRNMSALGPLDPHDADGDGSITVRDARFCVTRCTAPGCNAAE